MVGVTNRSSGGMSKVALAVGIDAYPSAALSGCVNDAIRVSALLKQNDDGSPNFSCYSLLSSGQQLGGKQ